MADTKTMIDRTPERAEAIKKGLKKAGLNFTTATKETDCSEGTLRHFVNGRNQSIRRQYFNEILELLGINDPDLNQRTTKQSKKPTLEKVDIIGYQQTTFSSENTILKQEPIGTILRPPALSDVRGLYAFYIQGSSMEPKHREGEITFASEDKPYSENDSVIVKEETPEGTKIIIGNYKERTDDTLVLEQLNPKSTQIHIPVKNVISVDRIYTVNEILGA